MCGTKGIRFRTVGSFADMTARQVRMRTQRRRMRDWGVRLRPVSPRGGLLPGDHHLACPQRRLLEIRRIGREDLPAGISLDSEWRDRAGFNGCGPAIAGTAMPS